MNEIRDVVVVGGGIVGSAIARELASYGVLSALIEREPDVCEGTSKANSGIAHTGFDSKPGTLESALLRRSREAWPQIAAALAIPYIPAGAVMAARNAEELDAVRGPIAEKARQNGVDVNLLTRGEVLSLAPYVTSEVIGGLLVPGESLVDPFWATRAFAGDAAAHGAEVIVGDGVVGIREGRPNETVVLTLVSGREIETRCVVNAAGLWSDDIASLAGDTSFRLTPRKGQFLLSEDDLGIDHIVLPVPNAKSKGILVTPLAIGGILMGPTAEDQEDKFDRTTTREGLALVMESTVKLVPVVAHAHSIRQFAGVRAVAASGDYIIRSSETLPRLFHVAGIRSTGVSASPGIAMHVAESLSRLGYLPAAKPAARPATDLANQGTLEEEGDVPNGGEVICRCRSITRGEIVRAMRGPLPPRTLDGLKRRTGAMLGECQGNRCTAKILAVMAEELGIRPEEIVKHAAGSYVAVAREEAKA